MWFSKPSLNWSNTPLSYPQMKHMFFMSSSLLLLSSLKAAKVSMMIPKMMFRNAIFTTMKKSKS